MLLNNITALNIEVAQKVPPWLRLTATDLSGHGGVTRMTSSQEKTLRAGARIVDAQCERRAAPEVQAYLSPLAPFQSGQRQAMMPDFSKAADKHDFMSAIQIKESSRAALLSKTYPITKMNGSNKIIVAPPTAKL